MYHFMILVLCKGLIVCLLAERRFEKKNNLMIIVHIFCYSFSAIKMNYQGSIPVVYSVSLLHHRPSLLLCGMTTLSDSHSIRYSREEIAVFPSRKVYWSWHI